MMTGSTATSYLRRGVEPQLRRALSVAPVVIVEGGRATGKTTLCRHVAEAEGFGEVVDLADPFLRGEAAADPVGFVDRLRTPALIDEAQLVDDLLVGVKLALDSRPGSGRYLLTGSSRIGRGALGGSDPLAGRAQWIRLWPLTQRERERSADSSVIPRLINDNPLDLHGKEPRSSVLARLRIGGIPTMPGVLPGDQRAAEASALAAYTEGSVHLAVGDRYDNARLARFFRHLAGNPAQILNTSRLASDAELDRGTVGRYLDALESGFLLHRVLAYRPLPHKRLTAHPRIHSTDVALAAWASGVLTGTLERRPERIGPLLETLVVDELTAQATWLDEAVEVMTWRSSSGAEVDVVLEAPDGTLVAIEVKAAERVDHRAVAGIAAFRRRFGDCRGFVFHTGTRAAPIDDRTWALPVSSLWS